MSAEMKQSETDTKPCCAHKGCSSQAAQSGVSQSGTAKFLEVTELAGDDITQEQLERMVTRYVWAKQYCEGKDVIEAACGTGQGLGYLSGIAKSLTAFDISDEILSSPRAHYGERVKIITCDALSMPFEDNSADTLLIYEALYYVPDLPKFFADVRRILRPGGHFLIVTANRDLYDFNPSPYSHTYLGTAGLKTELAKAGFEIAQMSGGTPVTSVSWKQKVLRPVKKIVVNLGLMPKTMAGKKLLKRLVFGQMVPMPAEITAQSAAYTAPEPISADTPNQTHKVIYCAARSTK